MAEKKKNGLKTVLAFVGTIPIDTGPDVVEYIPKWLLNLFQSWDGAEE